MKKIVKNSVLFLLAIFSLAINTAIASASMPSAANVNNIRIGLETKFQESSSVDIGNGSVSVGYESGGVFYSCATVSKSESFSMIPANLYYCRTSQTFSSLSDAQAVSTQLRNAGYRASPALLDINIWTVYVGSSSADDCANNAQKIGGSVQPVSRRRTALLDGDNTVIIFDNSDKFGQIASPEGIMSLGDRKYRGVIEFNRYLEKNITPVNVLSLDDYILSAVPSEMPQSWHMEALKAQAVASRTYAVSKIGSHNKSEYDLCDKVHCQVYNGVGQEAESSTRAVRETAGQLIWYGQTPINAVFCSSSGGYTDDSENVWIEALPYLRSVKELNEPTAREWSRTYSLGDITSLLSANNINIGSATGVSIVRNKTTGRVSEMTISGSSGSTVLKKEEIRTFFSNSKQGMLDSRNFTLLNSLSTDSHAAVGNAVVGNMTAANTNYFAQGSGGASELDISNAFIVSVNGITKIDNVFVYGADNSHALSTPIPEVPVDPTGSYAYENIASTSNQITISGRGYGSGVGMSQHGAKGMAEIGYNYIQILEHYYTGTKVS